MTFHEEADSWSSSEEEIDVMMDTGFMIADQEALAK